MKKVLCVVAAGMTASLTLAELSPYISFSGGYAIANDIDYDAGGGNTGTQSLDDGYTIEGAFGVGLGKALRAELALGYQLNDFEDGDEDLTLITGMVNGYYDFATDSPLTPYVLAGIGAVDAEVDGETDTILGGQIGAGVGYALSKRVILDLKYKYLMADDADIDGVSAEGIGGHLIQLGARLNF